jgi:hypothetical protein
VGGAKLPEMEANSELALKSAAFVFALFVFCIEALWIERARLCF